MQTSYTEVVVLLTRLRAWRERKGFSQEELAEKAGITRAALSRLENCHAPPRPGTLKRLAVALELKPEDLSDPIA